jgi:hypothetical protein
VRAFNDNGGASSAIVSVTEAQPPVCEKVIFARDVSTGDDASDMLTFHDDGGGGGGTRVRGPAVLHYSASIAAADAAVRRVPSIVARKKRMQADLQRFHDAAATAQSNVTMRRQCDDETRLRDLAELRLYNGWTHRVFQAADASAAPVSPRVKYTRGEDTRVCDDSDSDSEEEGASALHGVDADSHRHFRRLFKGQTIYASLLHGQSSVAADATATATSDDTTLTSGTVFPPLPAQPSKRLCASPSVRPFDHNTPRRMAAARQTPPTLTTLSPYVAVSPAAASKRTRVSVRCASTVVPTVVAGADAVALYTSAVPSAMPVYLAPRGRSLVNVNVKDCATTTEVENKVPVVQASLLAPSEAKEVVDEGLPVDAYNHRFDDAAAAADDWHGLQVTLSARPERQPSLWTAKGLPRDAGPLVVEARNHVDALLVSGATHAPLASHHVQWRSPDDDGANVTLELKPPALHVTRRLSTKRLHERAHSELGVPATSTPTIPPLTPLISNSFSKRSASELVGERVALTPRKKS